MEPTPEQRLERHYTQFLSEQHSKLIFDELFEFASEVCFTEPVEIQTSPDSEEKAIVREFGLRGIRTAVEFSNPSIDLSYYNVKRDVPEKSTEEEPKEPTNPFVELITPLTHPDLFSTSLSGAIQDKIEAFGSKLLDTAYKTLGTDVDQKIASMKEASTWEAQMEVINWLHQRLVDFVLTGKDPEEERYIEKEFAYQPFRISPKVLGVYPTNAERPTCLSVSIIAASFFQQAGIDTLHTDVLLSGNDSTLFAGHSFTNSLADNSETYMGLTLHTPAREAIKNLSENMRKQMTRSDAQHAAVYARLIDGSWCQFDSNFLSTFRFNKNDEPSHFDSLLADITHLSEVAPGVEVTMQNFTAMVPEAYVFLEIIKNMSAERIAALRDRAERVLKEVGESALFETLYNECIEPFFTADQNDESTLHSELRYIMSLPRSIRNGSGLEPGIKSAFYTVAQKYLLWGESPEVFIEKLHNDEHYFAERVEDLTTLPIMMMVAEIKMEAEELTTWYPHAIIGVGKPSYRIGAAVLSDFALYYDFPLPPSFWMSYWPGNAAVIEHMDGDLSIRTDYATTVNNVIYHEVHPFTSTKNHDIIQSFLSSLDPEGD